MEPVRGLNGFPVDTNDGMKWLHRAAEQRNPTAVFHLSQIYCEDLDSVVMNPNQGQLAF